VKYLNPAAFGAPALGTFGNLGQGSILGPGFWEWDGAISREFALRNRRINFIGDVTVTLSRRPGLSRRR
jgi:hypothetical protein